MAVAYRNQLEMLKFLDVPTLLKSANIVSTAWAKAVNSHELWASIISADHEEEVAVESNRYETGQLAYKWYWEMKKSLYAFEDHDRFLDDVRKEEAEKRGEPFERKPTELIIMTLPAKAKKTVKFPENYLHCFHSSTVWLPPSDLFVCGGRFEDREETLLSPTYIVSLHDATFQALEDTPQINSPTLIYYKKTIYSFGGSVFPKEKTALSLATTRKFPLQTRQWTNLRGGEMPRPHCYGWAERYHAKVFIIGGFGSGGAIDEFDIPSETFRPLSLKLSSGSEAAFGIREKDSLLVLSGQKSFQLSLHELQTDLDPKATEGALQQDNVWMWNTPPIILGRVAYFVLFDMMLFQFDLVKKTVEQQNIKEN